MVVLGRMEGGITAIGTILSFWTSYKVVKAIRSRLTSKKESKREPLIQKKMYEEDIPKKVATKDKNIFKKLLSIKVNAVQKILLFSSMLNLALYPLYDNLWLGQAKTYVASASRRGYRDRGASNLIPGQVYPNTNRYTDEELFLWIAVTVVLLLGVFLFKSKRHDK